MGSSVHPFTDGDTVVPAGAPQEGTEPSTSGSRKGHAMEIDRCGLCGKTFQPLLSPKWVLSTFIACGVAFVATGVKILEGSKLIVQYSVDYTDMHFNDQGVGWFDIAVDRDMEPPVYVYYQLNGFSQNHRRHLTSRHDMIMKGQELPTLNPDDPNLDEKYPCFPSIVSGGRVNYPCGMVASSIFNDTFVIRVQEKDEEPRLLELDQKAESIAWRADLDGKKYRQIDPEGQVHEGTGTYQERLNMWITTLFPPVTCEQVDFSIPYEPVEVALRQAQVPDLGEVNVTDCQGYTSGKPTCNFVKGGRAFDCTGTHRTVQRPEWGLESGNFIVWMRTAGLDNFRKLWAVVRHPIPAGSIINVTFVNRFPVKKFHGKKAFWISNTSWMGGRNDFMGYTYIVVGSLCLLFGLTFLLRHLKYPRDLGDVNCLDWVPKPEQPSTFDHIG